MRLADLFARRQDYPVTAEAATRLALNAVAARNDRDALSGPSTPVLIRRKWIITFDEPGGIYGVDVSICARTASVEVEREMRWVHFDVLGASPLVADHEWGRMIVTGWPTTFKDVLMGPGIAREWDWRQCGTRHQTGVTNAVIDALIGMNASTIVLSRGVDGVLQVPTETIRYAESLGLTVHTGLTPDAIVTYNDLAQRGARVGAALHSTC